MFYKNDKRNNFLKSISLQEDRNEGALLNKVIGNMYILKNMTLEDLKKLNVEIKNKQEKLEKKKEILKTNILIRKANI